jgi:hypothetical protein
LGDDFFIELESVDLKLRDSQPSHVVIVEAPTIVAAFFQPAIDSIPGDSLDS